LKKLKIADATGCHFIGHSFCFLLPALIANNKGQINAFSCNSNATIIPTLKWDIFFLKRFLRAFRDLLCKKVSISYI